MIILDASTKSLVVVLGEAKATSDCDLTATYADVTVATFTDGCTDTATNGTSQVTWLAAPAATPATRRRVKQLTLFNNDTILHTVTVKYNDNGTLRVVWSGTVQSQQLLIFNGSVWNAGVNGTVGAAGLPGASGSGSPNADPWNRAALTAPPTVAGGTWTTQYATSSSPTPVFEDFSSPVNGVRLRVLTTAGNGVNHVYGVFQTRPGGAYDVYARFKRQKFTMSTNYNHYGLMLWDQTNTRYMIWGLGPDGPVWTSWSALTTLVSLLRPESNAGQVQNECDWWLRMHDDHGGSGASGHVTFYWSLDGNYWVTWGSLAYNAAGIDMTGFPTHVGFGMLCKDASTATEMALECGSWLVQ